MYKATVNGTKNLEVSFEGDAMLLDGQPIRANKSQLSELRSHWLLNDRSMNVEVVSADVVKKEFSVKVNNKLYTVQLKDRFDELLKSLGMESVGQKKMSEIKAPMPGMVLNILVHVGDADRPLSRLRKGLFKKRAQFEF